MDSSIDDSEHRFLCSGVSDEMNFPWRLGRQFTRTSFRHLHLTERIGIGAKSRRQGEMCGEESQLRAAAGVAHDAFSQIGGLGSTARYFRHYY